MSIQKTGKDNPKFREHEKTIYTVTSNYSKSLQNKVIDARTTSPEDCLPSKIILWQYHKSITVNGRKTATNNRKTSLKDFKGLYNKHDHDLLSIISSITKTCDKR